MNGSEKQIKWAEEIKSGMNFGKLRKMVNGNPIAIKAIDYVESNEIAAFWIEYKSYSGMQMMDKFLTSGLLIKGANYDHKAKMDKATGVITVTWTVIVSDGKGGYEETRTKTI
jgi:hypothetical protein